MAEEGETPARLRVPVVGVGASAGGLEALRRLFSSLPERTGAAWLVVQHLDPTRRSALAELLSRDTSMSVVEATSGAPLAAEHVYVAPPDRTLSVVSGTLQLRPLPELRTRRFPIDTCLTSVAEACGPRAVGVILSGTGSDGSRGVVAVERAGGLVLVQDPADATHDGMPRAALATGMVDVRARPEDMPEVIDRFLRHPYARPEATVESAPPPLDRVLATIARETGHDFKGYKLGTLQRRVQRRMGLAGVERPEDYLARLEEDPEEVRRLYADCLIGVTRFFREPSVFERLARDALPALLRAVRDEPVRAWVPGCATGEEAYSMAMLLLEQVREHAPGRDVLVFATDIDEEALGLAREGYYAADRAADVGEERLARFFKREGDGWRVGRSLRESLVFAPQNLLHDPPFSQLDLVSCRNVLIYFEADVQRRLISVFHFALRDRGVLVLGAAEGIAGRTDLFRSLADRERIFARVPGARREPLDLERSAPFRRSKVAPTPRARHVSLREKVDRALVEAFAPPAVLCDAQGNALYFSGDTTPFLGRPSGEPTRSVVEMAGPALRGKLRVALHAGQRGDVVRESVRAETGDIAFEVRPVRGDEGQLFLVTFEPRADSIERPPPESPSEASALARLEAELAGTRDDLQSTIEELETANEELKASNEEILSMNEELQSTNEELETSKEELQSLNEELNTVNAQLQSKIGELEQITSDLRNLLVASDVPTLFLDLDLAIRRFTPATLHLFKLRDSDVGRPIGDIATRFEGGDLVADAERVLETLEPVDDEVRLADDVHYRRRIRPYRTIDDRIDGVVVTFSDVTPQKRAEHTITAAHQRLEELVAERTAELVAANASLEAEVEERAAAEGTLRTLVSTAADAIITIDRAGTIQTVNAAAERMFGYQGGEGTGRNVRQLMPPEYSRRHDEFLARYHRTGERRIIGTGREVTGQRKDGSTFAIELAVGEAETPRGRRYTGIIRDISERKRLEEEIRQAQKMEAVGRLASGVAHDFNNLLMGISGAADMSRDQLAEGHPAQAYLDEIAEAARGGASISRQLLAIARRREPEAVSLDLRSLVARTRQLLGRLIGEDIELAVSLPDEPLWVCCDDGQLEQVLLNLSVNARDAMPRGGRVELAAEAVVLDGAEARSRALEPGRYARLEVRDTGVGIDTDALPHVFEPFFTTKAPGKGTGLGLSTVYGIVKDASGHVEVSTERGVGTTFTIHLPAVAAPEEDDDAPAPSVAEGAGRTALVVEDEPLVRMAVRHYLEGAGFHVLDANDGGEAIDLAEAVGHIALLLTDVVLPNARGLEVAAAVTAGHPEAAVFFMSAHPLDYLLAEGHVPEGAEVLQKPFTEDELRARVADVMEPGREDDSRV